MKLIRNCFNMVLILSIGIFQSWAQEQSEEPQQVLTQKGYNKSAPAVIKLVTDEGKKIGTGVILGVHKDDVGFVLTSYSTVAGRDKVAIILKNYPEPLLGYTVDKWIDFDTELAVVAIKKFPPGQPVITFGGSKSAKVGETFTIIGHIEGSDWMPIPLELMDSNERRFALESSEYSGFEGGPLLNENGYMIGLIVSEEEEAAEKGRLTLAVKSNVIKPIINEWFQPIELKQKWHEKGAGLATWIWAVGGGVLGGTVATAIAIAGGGEEAHKGLPRPPEPPPTDQ
ncbi:MAG: serine protease [bacterium]